MALTKITGQVVNTSTDLTVGVLTATTVSVGGTLTYEDVTNVDSVGLITARNGIEVTDKGVQVGTGATVDSAAANTLTFLTGGSERIRVNSTGLVGIGTATPTDTNSFTRALDVSGPSGSAVYLRTAGGASDAYGLVGHYGTTLHLRNESAGDLRLSTDGTERLRVTSGGLVGINTTPGTILEINGESGKEATVTFNRQPTQGTNNGVIGELMFENATDSVALLSVKRESAADDAYFQFATQATGGGLTEQLRITSAGKVGIGDDNPARNLVVKASGQSDILIESGNSNYSQLIFGDSDTEFRGSVSYNHNGDTMQLYTAGSEQLRITSAGKVLVNTTTNGSGANLQVAPGGGIIAIGGDATGNGSGYFKFLCSNSTNNWQISTNNTTSGALEFAKSTSGGGSTYDTPSMLISSAGLVGIGENSPDTKLHVKGGSLTVEHASPSTGTCQLNINCENNSQVSCSFDDQGHISFGTASTPHNQGSFSEKVRIQNGGGISFNGDHASSNALDDYEEGSFTPTYTSGLLNPSYSSTVGWYIKIGKQVIFNLRIQASGTNQNDHVKIGGLPFTHEASGGLAGKEGAAFFNYPGNLTEDQDRGFPILHISTGSTNIEFIEHNKANWTGTYANGISGRDLHISGFYRAA